MKIEARKGGISETQFLAALIQWLRWTAFYRSLEDSRAFLAAFSDSFNAIVGTRSLSEIELLAALIKAVDELHAEGTVTSSQVRAMGERGFPPQERVAAILESGAKFVEDVRAGLYATGSERVQP